MGSQDIASTAHANSNSPSAHYWTCLNVPLRAVSGQFRNMRVVRPGRVPAGGNLRLGRCGEFWVYDLDDIEDGDSNDDVTSQSA